MSKSCALPKGAFPEKFKVKSPVHALELARGLIRPFSHWVVGGLAAVRPGKENEEFTAVKSPKAEAFCALGALLRVNTKHAEAAKLFLAQAACIMVGDDPESAIEDDIVNLNDAGARDKENHRTVVKMFTKAIQLVKKAAKAKK